MFNFFLYMIVVATVIVYVHSFRLDTFVQPKNGAYIQSDQDTRHMLLVTNPYVNLINVVCKCRLIKSTVISITFGTDRPEQTV